MSTLALKTDERVEAVYFTRDSIVVDLMDGRSISAPLMWYPKLLHASTKEKSHWEISGGGFGIHWPDIDEDLSTKGLLRGAPAPLTTKNKKKIQTRKRTLVKRSKSPPKSAKS